MAQNFIFFVVTLNNIASDVISVETVCCVIYLASDNRFIAVDRRQQAVLVE
jgi:hypothetical protein